MVLPVAAAAKGVGELMALPVAAAAGGVDES